MTRKDGIQEHQEQDEFPLREERPGKSEMDQWEGQQAACGTSLPSGAPKK